MMKTEQRLFLATMVSLWMASSQPLNAVSVTNLPTADTALRSSEPDSNFGVSTDLPVGISKFGSPINNGLFRFDLSSIPSSATINSAALQLHVNLSSPTIPTRDFELHRLLKDWGEGMGAGILATNNEATWNSRFHLASTWDAGGGQSGTDYATTASSIAPLAESGSTSEFSSNALTADVQLWVANPSTNFGWVLIVSGSLSSSGKLVGSRESTGNEPRLIVDYTVANPPAAPPLLTNITASAGQFIFAFDAEADRTYTVEARTSLTSGSWSPATNFPSQASPATIAVTNPISGTEGYFRVRTP